MNTLEALRSRRSVRAFDAKPVSRNVIEAIVDVARLAPTARNVQPWEFIAVTDTPVLKSLGSFIENGPFIADCACCIIIACLDTKYYLEDGCAATENILLAATELGVSSCWVAGDKKPYCDKVKAVLGIPADFKLVSLIPLGYSKIKPALPSKKPLKAMLHWERW